MVISYVLLTPAAASLTLKVCLPLPDWRYNCELLAQILPPDAELGLFTWITPSDAMRNLSDPTVVPAPPLNNLRPPSCPKVTAPCNQLESPVLRAVNSTPAPFWLPSASWPNNEILASV